MQLTVHTLDSAPAGSIPVLEELAADVGTVPNMAATMAGSPTLLAAFDGIRRAVGAGRLDPVLRETAGLATGVVVDNRYGVAWHSTVLGRLGVEEAEIERMRAGQAPAEPRRAAVYALAQAVASGRGKVADGVVAAAEQAGLESEQLLEVLTECVFAAMVGTVDNFAGRVELDEFLAPRAWS